MVVENDPGTQALIKRALQPLGCHLVVAQNGPEALKRLRQTIPNLFIVDLGLPQMDGWEFIQKLRDDSGFGAIPVVVLSAHGGFWDKVVTSRAMKVRAYLKKPFDPDELRDVVRKALRIKDKG
jgi:two-component system NarL family response regulator